MIILYYYVFIGVVIGCYLTYKLVERWGWQDLYEYMKQDVPEDIEIISLEGFKIVLSIILIVSCSFAWLPVLGYLLIEKYK